MKIQLTNIALEGTCNGDVVGGLLLWTGESLQALLFLRKPEALRAPTMDDLMFPGSYYQRKKEEVKMASRKSILKMIEVRLEGIQELVNDYINNYGVLDSITQKEYSRFEELRDDINIAINEILNLADDSE